MRKKTQNLTKKKQMKTSTRKKLDVKHGSCSKQKSASITIEEYVLYGHVSYASPPIWKLHPHGDIISQLYKPAFYSSHLSHNTPYGSAATIQVFCLPQ